MSSLTCFALSNTMEAFFSLFAKTVDGAIHVLHLSQPCIAEVETLKHVMVWHGSAVKSREVRGWTLANIGHKEEEGHGRLILSASWNNYDSLVSKKDGRPPWTTLRKQTPYLDRKRIWERSTKSNNVENWI